jgi:hypothetical protein
MTMVFVDNHVCTCVQRNFVMIDNIPVDYDRILRNETDYVNTLVGNVTALVHYVIRFIPYMDLGVYCIRSDQDTHSVQNILTGTRIDDNDVFTDLFSFDNNLQTLFYGGGGIIRKRSFPRRSVMDVKLLSEDCDLSQSSASLNDGRCSSSAQ